MSTEQEGLDALNQIVSTLEEEQVRGIPSLADVCYQYRRVKPVVDKALGLVELIPVYGFKIAITIRFLSKVADLACPAAPGGTS
jgi:hypothetical protein